MKAKLTPDDLLDIEETTAKICDLLNEKDWSFECSVETLSWVVAYALSICEKEEVSEFMNLFNREILIKYLIWKQVND